MNHKSRLLILIVSGLAVFYLTGIDFEANLEHREVSINKEKLTLESTQGADALKLANFSSKDKRAFESEQSDILKDTNTATESDAEVELIVESVSDAKLRPIESLITQNEDGVYFNFAELNNFQVDNMNSAIIALNEGVESELSQEAHIELSAIMDRELANSDSAFLASIGCSDSICSVLIGGANQQELNDVFEAVYDADLMRKVIKQSAIGGFRDNGYNYSILLGVITSP